MAKKAETFNLNEKYKSRVNNIAKGCEYEIIKKNKTTCWVKLWEDGVEKDTIYKNIPYSTFFPKNN